MCLMNRTTSMPRSVLHLTLKMCQSFYLGTRVDLKRLPDRGTDPYPMKYQRTDLGEVGLLSNYWYSGCNLMRDNPLTRREIPVPQH